MNRTGGTGCCFNLRRFFCGARETKTQIPLLRSPEGPYYSQRSGAADATGQRTLQIDGAGLIASRDLLQARSATPPIDIPREGDTDLTGSTVVEDQRLQTLFYSGKAGDANPEDEDYLKKVQENFTRMEFREARKAESKDEKVKM